MKIARTAGRTHLRDARQPECAQAMPRARANGQTPCNATARMGRQSSSNGGKPLSLPVLRGRQDAAGLTGAPGAGIGAP